MTPENFEKILSKRMEKISLTLAFKSTEYARNNDRLSNFKRAAAFLKQSPLSALRGSWVKHLTSIFDLIDDREKGIIHPFDHWDQKITDAVNYLILLEAILLEEGSGNVVIKKEEKNEN